MSLLQRFVPLTRQLAGYDRKLLASDLSAGLTVGVMLIPQGMAYALIAGMPPIYGLYASLVPLVVYALMGTSRQLSVGPVAMVSLLVAAGVGPLAGGDPQRYIELALLLALMVGVLQLAMGLLRFGFLTNFLSHPVLAGFTSAAALIIGASQLRHLVGVDLPGSNHVHEIVVALVRQLGSVHPLTLAVGLAAIGLLVLLKRWRPTFPGALAVVALFTGAVALFGLERAGLRVVGDVPGGLPLPTWPGLDPAAIQGLLPVALAIALVGFMESIAVAKVYATKHRYDVDPNQELVALGAANLVGALFRAFPTTGGFSRTAVNDQAGARTTVATLVSAGDHRRHAPVPHGPLPGLPNAVLAAIVLTAVANLVQWREAVHLWHVDRRDFAMMMVTFGATLGLGIEEGILVGVLVSLGRWSTRRRVRIRRCWAGCPGPTRSGTWPASGGRAVEGITVYRLDAALCFANAEFLRDQVRDLAERSPAPRALVFDFHAVNGMDSTALHHVEELLEYLDGLGVDLYFAGVKGPVMDRFRRAGLQERVGKDRFFYEVSQAVEEDRLALALSRRGPERVEPGAAVDARVRAPGPEWEGPLLEALPLPNHVGCGHLRLLLEEPERYEVRPALVEEVIRSFFRRLWTGDPRLVLDILEGEHEEVAVVQVRTEGAPGLVTACPHFGATDLFVHHPEAVARLHALHAAFLARSGRIPAERVPKVLRFQEDLGVRHVETTLGRLAPGLPVFDVHLQASSRERPSSVEVRSAGRVPHPQELHGGRPQP
jgi:sulfate permease, SulP family